MKRCYTGSAFSQLVKNRHYTHLTGENRLISTVMIADDFARVELGKMASLLMPDKIVLRLVDSGSNPVHMANILFLVRTFAKRKNDFQLGPFVTDEEGVVTITKQDLLAEATAHYDSGLMDYDAVENCQPMVEIAAMVPREIEKALEARTRVWKRLLRGETQRWKTIEDLRNLYRTAANERISVQPIRVLWDGSENQCEYLVPAVLR